MYIDAEEYLKEIWQIKKSIDNKKRLLSEIDEEIGVSAIRYDGDRISSSPQKDGLEKLAIAHIERRKKLREKIEAEITALLERKEEAINLINQIESDDQKEILMLRYIECREWSEIFIIRRCDDDRSQYKLHRRAIDSLQNVLEKYVMTT